MFLKDSKKVLSNTLHFARSSVLQSLVDEKLALSKRRDFDLFHELCSDWLTDEALPEEQVEIVDVLEEKVVVFPFDFAVDSLHKEHNLLVFHCLYRSDNCVSHMEQTPWKFILPMDQVTNQTLKGRDGS